MVGLLKQWSTRGAHIAPSPRKRRKVWHAMGQEDKSHEGNELRRATYPESISRCASQDQGCQTKKRKRETIREAEARSDAF